MDTNISITKRRTWLTINYISVLLIILAYYAISSLIWNRLYYVGIAILIIIATLSFFQVFWKSGIWKMTHISVKKLDERENKIVHNALRISYSIFSIIVLILIYFNSVLGDTNFAIIIATALLYIAHTLPGAYLAWTEKLI